MNRIFRPQVKEYLFHRFVQNNCNIGFTYNKNGQNNRSNLLYRSIKHIDTVKNNSFNMVYTDRIDVAAKCAISYVKNQDNPGLIFVNPSPKSKSNMEDNDTRDYLKLVKSCIDSSWSSSNPLIIVNLFYKKHDETVDMLLHGMIKDNIKINSSDGVEPALDYLFNDAIWKYQSRDKDGFRYESNNIFSLSVNHEILYERMDIELIDNVGMDRDMEMLVEAESELQYLERLYRKVEKDEK